MELIFVRHGETLHNAERRFQGQSHVPLSEAGRAQAQAAAEALRDEPITHIFTSDLRRARETAEAIANEHDLTIVPDERLREFDFGAWEGMTWAEIVDLSPELLDHAPTQPRHYLPPGGESFEDVVARVRAFLEQLRALPEDARVLIVAHAGVLHAAIAVLEPPGIDPQRIAFANGSITRLTLPQ